MPYAPGGDCNIGAQQSTKLCDGCFPSKNTSPVVVKIIRPINRNANRMGRGGRMPHGMPSNRGDCCKWCIHKQNANQMVFNQNKIVNFDLINRINDVSGVSPNLTYTATPPGGPPGKRTCDNCINILRDKELQLLKKEQEILKIKTHFTNLPKRGGVQEGLGANCEQCFRALREKEFELFRKDQEISKMKRAAALKSPIDTQAKVDRARCANCFKALRQKELELIKKEHALLKNMNRPNINVKNLNYCSCCRDNKKSSINKMKQQEELRRKNRDNCFKQIRMKEIRLIAKEREIEKKIQKFREESIAKAKMDLEKTPDARLIKPTTKEVIKCVCSCTGLPEFKKQREKAKGVCSFFYKKFPKAAGGWSGPSEVTIGGECQLIKSPSSIDQKLTAKALKARRCTRPCCVMKMASNMAACFLTPPKGKKPKELSERCAFMKMVSWCSPDKPKHVVKCCIIPSEPGNEPTIKEQKQLEKRIKAQKSIAIKAAKAAAESASEYKVDTIGRIRPGKSKPSSKESLTVWDEEVLKTYGPKGLRAYKTKMADLKIDTEVAQSKIPKRITSRGTYEALSPIKFSSKATKRSFMSKMGRQTESKDLQTATRAAADANLETEVPSPRFKSTRPTFKTKVYERTTRAAKKFKFKSGPGYARDVRVTPEKDGYSPDTAYGKIEGPITSKTMTYEDRLGPTPSRSEMTRKFKKDARKYKNMRAGEKMREDEETQKGPMKYKQRKRKERKEGYERDIPEQYRTKEEYERDIPKRYRTKVEYERDIPKQYRTKEEHERDIPKQYRTKEEHERDIPKQYRTKEEHERDIPKQYRTKEEHERDIPKQYRTKEEHERDIPKQYSTKEEYERDIPKRYRTKVKYERFIPKRYRTKVEYERDIPKRDRTKAEYERDIPKRYRTKEEHERDIPKRYRTKEEYERDIPKRYRTKEEYERDIPKRYRTKVDDEDYDVPRGYGSRRGSGDYFDEWGSVTGEKMRGPSGPTWYPSRLPACPTYLKIFGKTLVYCAGCFIGIPCILFLCLCFLATTCSD